MFSLTNYKVLQASLATFELALETKNYFSILDYIDRNLAYINTILQHQYEFNSRNHTILHHLFYRIYHSINQQQCITTIKTLLSNPSLDLDEIIDRNGNTLLHTAVNIKSEMLVEYLIAIKPSLIHRSNYQYITPADHAAECEDLLWAQNLFIKYGINKPIKGMNTKAKLGFSLYKKTAKVSLEKQSKSQRKKYIKKCDNETVRAIIGAMYLQDTTKYKQMRMLLKTLIEYPLLRPIFELSAIIAREGINHDPTKKLKIYMVNNRRVTPIRPASKALGVMSNERSIFVGSDFNFYNEMQETLVHELMHFVIKLVFQNSANPYTRNDSIMKKNVNTLIDSVLNKDKDPGWTQKECDCLENLQELKFYPQSEHASELIARIPEVVVTLGNEKAEKWYETNFPDIYIFYKFTILKKLEQYIEKLSVNMSFEDEHVIFPIKINMNM